jgi:shikimate kinase
LNERERFYTQADVRVCIREAEKPEEVARRAIEEIKKVIKPETAPDLN